MLLRQVERRVSVANRLHRLPFARPEFMASVCGRQNWRTFTVSPSQSKQPLVQFNIRQENTGPESTLVRRKRLQWRCKQRGMLELDLLMGSWAAKHAPSFDDNALNSLEELLEVETQDLVKWLIQSEPAPSELNDNYAFRSLQRYSREEAKSWITGKASGNQ